MNCKINCMKVVVLLSCIALLGVSCSTPEEEIIATYPNMVKNGSFEDLSVAGGLWSMEGSGEMQIQEGEAYAGWRALKVNPAECTELMYNEDLLVEADATYEISLATRLAGESTGCSAAFYLYLVQDGENVLAANIQPENAWEWKREVLYLFTTSSSPVEFRIITGNTNIELDEVTFRRVATL